MIVQANAAHLPFRTASIDLVLTSPPSDLDWSTRIQALAEIGRVTRPGGRVVVLANTPGQRVVGHLPYPAFTENLAKLQIGLNSKANDRVLDCFCGSGIVARVAKKMGRRGFGSELDPEIVRYAAQRRD